MVFFFFIYILLFIESFQFFWYLFLVKSVGTFLKNPRISCYGCRWRKHFHKASFEIIVLGEMIHVIGELHWNKRDCAEQAGDAREADHFRVIHDASLCPGLFRTNGRLTAARYPSCNPVRRQFTEYISPKILTYYQCNERKKQNKQKTHSWGC